MRIRSDIFHPDFKALPWWWEVDTQQRAVAGSAAQDRIVMVGAGYGGLSTALELRRNGVGAVVLERGDFGVGASTRNGGMISAAPPSARVWAARAIAEEWKKAGCWPTPPIR